MARGILKKPRAPNETAWHGVKNTREVARVRKELGLTPQIIRKRDCLRCGVKFESHGYQNRMCKSCNQFAEYQAPDREGFLFP